MAEENPGLSAEQMHALAQQNHTPSAEQLHAQYEAALKKGRFSEEKASPEAAAKPAGVVDKVENAVSEKWKDLEAKNPTLRIVMEWAGNQYDDIKDGIKNGIPDARHDYQAAQEDRINREIASPSTGGDNAAVVAQGQAEQRVIQPSEPANGQGGYTFITPRPPTTGGRQH